MSLNLNQFNAAGDPLGLVMVHHAREKPEDKSNTTIMTALDTSEPYYINFNVRELMCQANGDSACKLSFYTSRITDSGRMILAGYLNRFNHSNPDREEAFALVLQQSGPNQVPTEQMVVLPWFEGFISHVAQPEPSNDSAVVFAGHRIHNGATTVHLTFVDATASSVEN